ncbi:hypothetical protein TBLA_0B08360 [Henningerozyma blattae CBS 6284]|uniref:Activator of Hsp90 ATPase AHSA1-like N-terminal domain-containing protein n=1 Tax=Henningerozyma blattae (strain ATCC 34711 / CBS 6284 / DSM 70876 / NBRC 10599 / NRRL Y-10934 / UCD 77-7) TaxID=1071380 RepID=I2GZU9_HENB6|nr:hypothetical protein TBLA_0B08360 [Tetrapisispora blattae CBS 6284]CCH59651.1 hypothetical protein TBLA_0B08360 [Tetrapisispora blattae CBS 6284]
MAVLNPNNWHWVDKNTLPWTKEYLNTKFIDYQINSKDGKSIVKITKVTNVSGDSNVSQRKGKPICYFDLHLDMDLVILDKDLKEQSTGNIKIPEFMHDDEDFEVSTTGFDKEFEPVVVADFLPAFRKVLLEYQDDLLAEHSKYLRMD